MGLTEECHSKASQTDRAEADLKVVRKEYAKAVKQARSNMTEEQRMLNEQLENVKKNKKQYIKEILRSLIPEEVVAISDSPDYF